MASSLMEMLLTGPSGLDRLTSVLGMTAGMGLADLPGQMAGPSGGPMGGPMSGGPKAWINEALDITNSPQKWAGPLYELMMRESGGDPRARNPNPVASGQHAQGLFQTIPSTFQAHNMPRLGGINDPVANAVAAIRYIIGRYGTPYNLPSSGGY